MPRFAPLVKVARCRQFGAKVVLHGDTFDEARSEAGRLAEECELTYIHPFDDPQVIAGQGTLAFEILEQVPDAEAIVVPVGGGGLLAGVATVLQALKPSLQIIGVEPANAACFAAGLAADAPVRVSTKFTLADGLAVAEAGRHTLAIVAPLAYRMVTVEEEALALAMLRLAELEKCVIEGAGAAGLAALLGGSLPELQGRRVVLLLSGGNIDPLAHSRVIERGSGCGWADLSVRRADQRPAWRVGASLRGAGIRRSQRNGDRAQPDFFRPGSIPRSRALHRGNARSSAHCRDPATAGAKWRGVMLSNRSRLRLDAAIRACVSLASCVLPPLRGKDHPNQP